MSFAREPKSCKPTSKKVKFIQLLVQPYVSQDGREGSAVIALGDDGRAYRYYHSERAWVAMPTTILEKVDG